MEKISTPPYPGPPLESTSSVKQRPQPAPRTRYTNVESPGPQHNRCLPVENIPAPPYPGPPLDSLSSSAVQQRPCSFQPPPRTCYTTEECGAYNHQSPGCQHHSSLPMENIPAPPYPGPPLDSTSSLQPRAYTHQTPFHTDPVLLEGGPHSPLQSPSPQYQRFHHTHLHSPHPPNPCQYPESLGTSGIKGSTVLKGAVTDEQAYHTCHDKAEGVPCKNLPSNPTFYPTPNKQSISQGQKAGAHSRDLLLESRYSSEKSTVELSTEQNVKVSDPPPPYPGFALNLQSSDTPQQFRPDTSPSMYSYNYKVVHAGGSQVVTHQQRQVVVQPASQPSVVIQSPAPAYQVVQPPAPAVQVVQSPAPAYQVIQSPAPAYQVIQSPAPAYQVIQSPSPAVHVVQSPSPAVHVVQNPAPAVHVVQSPSPAVRLIQSAANATVYRRYY
ncbi:extensin-2-like isoform X2 [Tachysurus fulvidraco]|uniref:extensin-2-like isoform X2 n=1 Tax=Tachysurus fulvidraco TaxID=1234273 RepID=UPI001FEF063E|nr:extensin-2-like isoform X2 [Tachysurus fulvidraco]